MLKALEIGKENEALQHWIDAKDFDKEEKVKAVTEIYNSLNIRQLAEQKMNALF